MNPWERGIYIKDDGQVVIMFFCVDVD